MKRTISLKLQANPEQAAALSTLATAYTHACNSIVPFVQAHRCWNRVALHHLAYYAVRRQFPVLGSQMVCQAVRRVADSYRALNANGGIAGHKPVPSVTFSPFSVNFDRRTYSLKGEVLSLFTLAGRARIAFRCGQHQRNLLSTGTAREARLILRRGAWYFNLVLELPEAPAVTGSGVLGVDMGENNLAVTSSGKIWGGGKLRHGRDRYLAHRRRLQANGSRAARRKLKAISGREARHVRHVNHVTSKAIVEEACCVGASEIRLEDLTHIRDNIRAGKRVRTRLHRWAFRQLQAFVAYKAEAAGLRVVFVEPAYTSRSCSACGAIGKRERHRFTCSCGNRRHADVNAAANIAGFASPIGLARAVVNQPEFAHDGLRCAAKSSVP